MVLEKLRLLLEDNSELGKSGSVRQCQKEVNPLTPIFSVPSPHPHSSAFSQTLINTSY